MSSYVGVYVQWGHALRACSANLYLPDQLYAQRDMNTVAILAGGQELVNTQSVCVFGRASVAVLGAGL